MKSHLAALLSLWIVAVSSLASGAVRTNSAWFARDWQTDDGLPDSTVTGIAQTAEGYLWVATENGLASFDGVRFRKTTAPELQAPQRKLIRVLTPARGNKLWVALEGGVAICLSPLPNTATVITNLIKLRPVAMVEDAAEEVWIGYGDGGVCHIQRDGTVQRFTTQDRFPGIGGCYLACDQKGQVWFAKAGRVGVYRAGEFISLLNLDNENVRIAPARDGAMWICAGTRLMKYVEGGEPRDLGQFAPVRASTLPRAMMEDQSGALWIGTSASGLIRYDGEGFNRIETSHRDIESLGEDREGNVWVGTGGGGLNRLRPRVLELQRIESGLPFESVRSICEDSSGTLWAAVQNGDLARWRGTRWEVVGNTLGWTGEPATCVAPDAQGGVWIGTYRGGLHHWQDGKFTAIHARDGLASETIRSLLVDSRGDLWIGFEAPIRVQRWHAGQLQLFPLPVNSRPVRAWAEDPAGVVWMGTTDGRLFRAVGDALLEETSHTLQPSQPIRALHATADGSLWIGYAGAGVGRFKDGKFVRINSEAGLFDDYICGIMPDDLGRVWFTCNRGIFQVSQKELEAVADGRLERVRSMAFGRDESLPNLQATFGYWPGFVRSRDGRIWFPMRTGLAVVNAGGVRPNRLPPPVVIESALLDGRTFMPAKGELFVREDPSSSRGQERYDGRKNSIAPDHRKLEFRFTALTFIASESVYFRYRLEGYDDDWIDAGTKRSADYPRLPAGDYRFQVSACNSDGRWNPSGAELPFTVQAFFWNRWWFRLAAAIFFTAMIAGVVRYVSFRRLRTRLQLLEQETALQKDRARIAQDLHDDLGANLTQIALLSELTQNDLDKPTQARGHVDQIFRTARTLTRSLDEIVWSVNPKNDTLDRFVSHLCTYAPDFLRSAGVRCRLDVPVEVPAAPLSPDVRHHLHLAVKETLHNVAKHAGASEVRLALQFAPDRLTITVSDNGQGFRSEKELSPEADGLANMKQRMSAIGGRLEQHSEPGIGTVTTFVVPLGKVTA